MKKKMDEDIKCDICTLQGKTKNTAIGLIEMVENDYLPKDTLICPECIPYLKNTSMLLDLINRSKKPIVYDLNYQSLLNELYFDLSLKTKSSISSSKSSKKNIAKKVLVSIRPYIDEKSLVKYLKKNFSDLDKPKSFISSLIDNKQLIPKEISENERKFIIQYNNIHFPDQKISKTIKTFLFTKDFYDFLNNKAERELSLKRSKERAELSKYHKF